MLHKQFHEPPLPLPDEQEQFFLRQDFITYL